MGLSSHFLSKHTPRNLQLSTRFTLVDSIKSSRDGSGIRLALLAQNKIYEVLSIFSDNLFALNQSDNAAIS